MVAEYEARQGAARAEELAAQTRLLAEDNENAVEMAQLDREDIP